MAVATLNNLVDALRKNRILEPEQLEEVGRLQSRYSEPRDLARELIQRGWLTAYQGNLLLQGRGSELVLGGYVLIDRLGEGGMGQVLKARHSKMGRIVAVKIIKKERLNHPDAIRRFHREIQAAAQLHHPNVVMAFDADQIGDTHIFVMEYVEGIDLSRLVRQQGALPIRDACDYIRQAALGLQHALERGLVHRDIKPSNLFLCTGDTSKSTKSLNQSVVKVLDMGLARLSTPGEHNTQVTTLTQMGTVVGTPDYIAPEQARDARNADIRADIYSLGCTLYFVLAGQVPFSGGSVTEKLLKHHMDEVPEIEKLRPETPPALSAIIRKMMAKKPGDRYQTPAEVAAALEALLAEGLGGAQARVWSTEKAEKAKKASRVLVAKPAVAPATATNGPTEVAAPPPRAAQTAATGTGAGKRKMLVAGLVVGILLACLVLFGASRLFRKAGSGATNAFTGERDLSPLDSLSAESIPASERFPWEPKELVAVVGEHRGRHYGWPVRQIAFGPDDSVVTSAGGDGAVRTWDVATLREQSVMKGNLATVMAIAFSPDRTKWAVADEEGIVWLFDVNRSGGKEPYRLAGHTGRVFSLAFSPDGSMFASGGQDRSIRLWKLGDREPQMMGQPLTGHGNTIGALAFAPVGAVLASGCEDGNAALWDLTKEPPQARVLGRHRRGAGALAFSPDGATLATGSADATVRFWEVAAGTPKAEGTPLNSPVLALAYNPDGRSLACGLQNGLTLCDATGPQPAVRSALPSIGIVTAAAFASKKQLLACGTAGGVVQLYDTSGSELKELLLPKGHLGGVRTVSFSPDSKTLASGSWDRTVRLWEVGGSEPKESKVLNAQRNGVTSVTFAADGSRLAAAGSAAPMLHVWSGEGTEPRGWRAYGGGESFGWTVAFSPSGNSLASGGIEGKNNGTIQFWDLSAPQPRKDFTLQGHQSPVNGIAFSADGRTLVSHGYQDKSIRVWDVAGRKEKQNYTGAQWKTLSGLGFTSNGQLAAFGTENGVYLWHLSEPEPKELVPQKAGKYSRSVWATAFSPDGKTLASAGEEGRLILWDPAMRQDRMEFQLPGAVYGLAFAPDSRHLAVGNANGTIYILRLAPPPPRK